MELRHLRYFKVVAELQHFHKAADKLHISQPALSNQIKQLEQELNSNLFERVGRGVKLSESGELVLSSTIKILNEVELLKESVSDIELGQAGTLKIGVLQSINSLYLRSLVAEFDRNNPNISLQIEEMTNHNIEKKVARGDIDIGIGFILQKDYPDIEFERLFDENWKLILSLSHAGLAQDIMTGKPHPLKAILLSEYFETRKIVDKYFTDNQIKYTNVTEVNTISSILDLVEGGTSFSILPEAFSALKAQYRLEICDLNPSLPPRTIGLLVAKNRSRKKTVEKFCDLVREQLSQV
ncbi:MAG: LysR substrate-binding domain-containing protein [Gammaproteobacteria bacterium]|nr:LysR substrate-binding domain-containing protein [Gammaproteobacteria bacterium]